MKKTNKGFSLVELIIVIAIMAILAGALAPALIKYINKSRVSADITTGNTIASAIQTAMTDEAAFDEVTNYSGEFSGFYSTTTDLKAEIESIVGTTAPVGKAKKDAQNNALDQKFYVNVDPSQNLVQVFVGDQTMAAGHMVYPTVGADLTY